MDQRIDYACRSFQHNREIAEKTLRDTRKYINILRHGRPRFPLWVYLLPGLSQWAWHHDARVAIRNAKEFRQRIQIYRRVEKGLKTGNLSVAIEALSEFCPKSETLSTTVRRIRRDMFLSPLEAISRSPNVLRKNMLQLRANLMEIQKQGAA